MPDAHSANHCSTSLDRPLFACRAELQGAQAQQQAAELAKIELSLKLAEVAAAQSSGGDVSGLPVRRHSSSGGPSDLQEMQRRYKNHCQPALAHANVLQLFFRAGWCQ